MPLQLSGVTIFSKAVCPFCTRAKEFFQKNNISYNEVLLDHKSETYHDVVEELLDRTNQNTFPYIFIGETFVGGYSDMMAAYDTLKLHELLKTIGITLEVDF